MRLGRGSGREDGFTMLELLVALGVVAILITIAVPMFLGQRNAARDTAAQSELRQVLMPLRTHLAEVPDSADVEAGVVALTPSAHIDDTAVLGVKLERAADGSTCLWRSSDSGTVFGMWEPAPGVVGQTLYTERSAVPGSCPDATDTASFGFVAGSW